MEGPDSLATLQAAVDAEPDVPAHHANLGVALSALGQHDHAAAALRRALAALDDQRALLGYNLAASLAAQGLLDDAARAYENALTARPGWQLAIDNLAGVRYHRGVQLYAAGDPAAAVGQLRAALELAPTSVAAAHDLALALIATDAVSDAIDALRRALALDPTIADADARLGVLLLRRGGPGDGADALRAAERACEARPDDAAAHGIRGAALATLRRPADALAAYDRARVLAPDRVEVHISYARGAEELDHHESVVGAYRAALAIDPDHLGALHNLVRVLTSLERPAEAVPLCERLLALAPDDPLTPHKLAALRGETTAAAPRTYVVSMFDDMAPRFDALLVDALEYHVPEMVRAALARVAPERRFAHVLDLGCGTGLTGAQLRSVADVMHGVDLAPKMVDAARARGVYDEVHVGEVVEYLAETTARYELIVATDVLVYIGDLEPLFEAARAALAGGGLFACSVERYDGVDYQLGITGRYRHSRDYVERLAEAHDLDVLTFDTVECRLEAGAFVPAWLFVLSAGRARSAGRGRAPRGRGR